MKYALIGCGRIAVNHVKAVVNNNLEFVAACDIELANIDSLFDKTNYADRERVVRYEDYKKIYMFRSIKHCCVCKPDAEGKS